MSAAAQARPVLVTIGISHYCEKARWALDRAGVGYEERPHVQLVHRFASRRAGGKGTVPVLVTGEGPVLGESAEIVAWADARTQPERRLVPEDDGARTAALARCADFDAQLGPEARGWMYHHLRERPDIARDYGLDGVARWERTFLGAGFPLAIRVISRVLDVTAESAERGEARVQQTFDDVAGTLADGRPYLDGERFGISDLTFSALAAAVLLPPQYGVTLPSPDVLPPGMGARVRAFREHPAGQHALHCYREERDGSRALP